MSFGALETNLSDALLLDALHRKDVLSRGGQLHFPIQEYSCSPVGVVVVVVVFFVTVCFC